MKQKENTDQMIYSLFLILCVFVCVFMLTCLLCNISDVSLYIPGNIAVLKLLFELDKKSISFQNIKSLCADLQVLF